jgi:SpoVK/Ycf46/Vps4 family AAA+-type ATPase
VVVETPEVPLARLVISAAAATGLEHVLVLSEAGTSRAGGRGVTALFCGPSGTGKTLAARAIATTLDVPLYRVDLATIVSKWIGETEKNLRAALSASEASGAILFFDEGDSLLAKRGEVSRGTDRYANLEVSYLLQAMESHDGVVIVATNLKQNIDTAFFRRFDVCIEFNQPTPAERARLWKQELGALADGLPAPFLRNIASAELTGGNIASAGRLALALCARRGATSLSEADVMTAIAGEFQKFGSTVQGAQWAERARRHGGSGDA